MEASSMLTQMLHQTVITTPNKPAIIYGDNQLTYANLFTQIVGFSRYLQKLGIQPGDGLMLVLPNTPTFIVSFYAAAALQATILPVNPLLKASEIETYLTDTPEIKVIITDSAHLETCQTAVATPAHPVKIITVDGNSLHYVDIPALSQPFTLADLPTREPYNGPFLYQYSSGSTGRPKKLYRTQANLFHQATNCTTTMQVTAQDNILALVPMFHAYGLGECLLAATCTGATLVILPPTIEQGHQVNLPFIFRRQYILDLIAAQKITVLPLVPYMVSVLANTPPEIAVDLSSLRLVLSAGNFLGHDIFIQFRTRFNHLARQLYGCTEAGAVAINMEDASDFQYNAIGQPMHNVQIDIVDEMGKVSPPETVGELLIRSQTLTAGYINRPELNQQVFSDGGFLTGDLGKKDAKGQLYITGRKKIFIDTGGHKVDPLEVEDVLSRHPNVQEVVVVGVPHTATNQIVKAVIIPNGECTTADLLAYCHTYLADFKVPRQLEFRAELPKSSLGKILRGQLV